MQFACTRPLLAGFAVMLLAAVLLYSSSSTHIARRAVSCLAENTTEIDELRAEITELRAEHRVALQQLRRERAAREQWQQDMLKAPRKSFPYTLVTAANENHECVLVKQLLLLAEQLAQIGLHRRPQLVVYDLGFSNHTRLYLEAQREKGLFDSLITFNFSAHPAFWDLNKHPKTNGEYGDPNCACWIVADGVQVGSSESSANPSRATAASWCGLTVVTASPERR